ncbi:MAG: NTP transferase domain-containing protein [Bacteroidales bacterium]|nr:NTP transferase domain-containing protein [Bacteroidales bacterium]
MLEHKSISALILAAGNSMRMGRDKASLPYGNGLTFAGQLISTYAQSGCSPITIVMNERSRLTIPSSGEVQLVVNKHVEKGRSWSIWLGLQKTPEGHSCYIQNVDNPYTDSALLLLLYKALSPKRYIVPMCDGKGGHPILLGCEIVDKLRKNSNIPDLRKALLEFERFEVFFPDKRILLNLNTPDDYLNFIKPV